MTSVSEREPQIIYYSISGFGQTGPLAARPAMDPVLQAMIGIVNENRGEHDNHPHRIAISLIDMFTGLLGFQAIATSLYVRREQKARPFPRSEPDAGRRDAVGDPPDRATTWSAARRSAPACRTACSTRRTVRST